MANKKTEGTYEETLNKPEVLFLKYKNQFIIAVVAVVAILGGYLLYSNLIT